MFVLSAWFGVIVVFSLAVVTLALGEEKAAELLADLEKLSVLGEKAPLPLIESLSERIERQSTNLTSVFRGKINEPSMSE
jgi:hypothetical protein